ncbi:hypothetical protein [Gemmatirosa kalamazoonensis]|nr:hypothetical protein [Gemmatirosa kalamazoonensis]
MTRTARRLTMFALSAVALLAPEACSLHRRPPAPLDPAADAAAQWPEARRIAQNFALARAFADADSTLRAFAARFPGTPSAAETVYWRALVRLDPTSDEQPSAEVLRDVRTWLDAYIAGGPLQEHYVDAVVLRRIATRFDSLRMAADTRPVPVAAAPAIVNGNLVARDSLKVRDDEIQRLRQELDQAKAELERIRRRLAPPRP